MFDSFIRLRPKRLFIPSQVFLMLFIDYLRSSCGKKSFYLFVWASIYFVTINFVSFIVTRITEWFLDLNWSSDTFCYPQSSAKPRNYEKTLKSSGKCFIYGKLLRHRTKSFTKFSPSDTLREAFLLGTRRVISSIITRNFFVTRNQQPVAIGTQLVE